MDTLIGAVPDSWRTLRLDECCDVQSGPSGTMLKASEYVMRGVPVVKAEDVGPEGVSMAPGRSVSAETAERLVRYRLYPDDIVFVRIGVTTRHAMVTGGQAGWLLGGSCIRVRTLRDVTPGYLACYLTHPAVQEWLVDHKQRGVLPTVNARTLCGLPLVLPPAAVQQSVLEVASLIDAKIRAHENVIQTTRALREQLLPRLLAGDPIAPSASPVPPKKI